MWIFSGRLFGRLVFLGFAMVAGLGCATSRGILDVQIPTVANPSGAKTIAITQVTDVRQFELSPSMPSIPYIDLPAASLDGQLAVIEFKRADSRLPPGSMRLAAVSLWA